MSRQEIQTHCDAQLSTSSEPEAQDANICAAIGQLFSIDGVAIRWEGDRLEVQCQQLQDRMFGFDPTTRAELRLCGNTSELKNYMHQWCVEGSSAVLVGPKHVLTTAHSVIREKISSHVFVLGRTQDDSLRVVGGKMWIPRARVHQANRLIAYVHDPRETDATNIDHTEADWALLELDKPVAGVTPLPVRHFVGGRESSVFGHPLGLPIKRATTYPVPSGSPKFALFTDNGAGGSGSAIIQDGAVVGILRGRVDAAHRWIRSGERPCIDFSHPNCEIAQPFTPGQRFMPTLPGIFGETP